MNPSCNRLSLRQATRRVTQLCDQALAPLDLRATQLSGGGPSRAARLPPENLPASVAGVGE
jgi:hypothetical protein